MRRKFRLWLNKEKKFVKIISVNFNITEGTIETIKYIDEDEKGGYEKKFVFNSYKMEDKNEDIGILTENTFIKDCNFNHIFKGDIVKDLETGEEYIVKYGSENSQIPGCYILVNDSKCDPIYKFNPDNLLIVGNVFQKKQH